jgi:hypothetical protein
MADDRDLGRELPDPPPPRPDRREAAIDTAVARFKGEAAPARPIPPRRRWTRVGPQIGAVAATALVVVIGLPVWRSGTIETPAPRPTTAAATDPVAAAPPPRSEVARPVAAPSTAVPKAAEPSPAAKPAAAAETSAPRPPAATTARTAPPPPVVVQSVTTPPPVYAPLPSPPPPSAAAAPQQMAAMPAEDVVVTGARVVRNDWARCTVEDPRRTLAACRARFGLAKPGVKGRAEALTGDGVLRAWQGDRAGALATLDRAIAVEATADALVNRALLRMAAGDDAGALADLDRAVRRSPRDGRGYHYRGIVQARLGKSEQAAADARRAAALDEEAR